MIRKLLATTALASAVASGAFAQEATTTAPAQTPAAEAPATPAIVPSDGFLATNLIGENVYNGRSEDSRSIGDVNDLVLSHSGQVDAVVVGVGGFLGLGEKNVALNFKDLSWAERDGDRWLVVDASKEQLEALPDFDRRPYDVVTPVASNSTAEPATGTTAMAPAATTDQPAASNTAEAPAATTEQPATTQTTEAPAATDRTHTGAIDRSTLTEIPAANIRSEELVGTTVYGANDTNVGEIGDVVLTTDGKVDAVILDVGGFLGMGEKEVAVGMDNLSFMQDADGNKYLYTNLSKEQLESQAPYDKATYSEHRDTQRMMTR